ncbi:MAG: polyprenyl synthetase family protein [Desulfobacterales bacterium]|jgi:hypothetical protein
MAPIIEHIEDLKQREAVGKENPFTLLEDELHEALSLYWEAAARILEGSGIHLIQPETKSFALRKQFFSALFLYSYHQAAISPPRRILYAAANQCLRGIVAGCDNLLDDEYRKTLETDLPKKGTRFRSVMDIMVSERVLFELLFTRYRKGDFSGPKLLAASAALFRALARSGMPAASEEGGVSEILTPEDVLTSVHHFKTGLLFQSPWAIPLILEDMEPESVSHLLTALYRIGLGCQIMDDMVDLADDVRCGRHNYVASLVYHGEGKDAWDRLRRITEMPEDIRSVDGFLLTFPSVRKTASILVRDSLTEGLQGLYDPAHHHLIEPTIDFLARRIGAEGAMADAL